MPGALTAGQLVDERYSLEEPLGRDAFGTVWRAHDRGLGRGVCLREVRLADPVAADPALRQAALAVARTAIRVDHPGAIHLWDAFLDGDHLVIVTEPIKGIPLRAVLAQKRSLAPKRVAAIALDLVAPLQSAHAIGIAHGGISPAAIVVNDRPAAPAQLSEFGLAPSFRDPSAYAWAEMAGIAAYLAPEQAALRGSSPEGDLWSLGATLYHAVEGEPPFAEETAAATLAAVDSRAARHMSKAGSLTGLLNNLLDKDPAARPALDEVRRRLAVVAGVDLDTPPAKSRRTRRDGKAGRADGTTTAEPLADGAPENGGETGETGEVGTPGITVEPIADEPGWSDGLDRQFDGDQWLEWPADEEASDVWLAGGGSAAAGPEEFVPPPVPDDAAADDFGDAEADSDDAREEPWGEPATHTVSDIGTILPAPPDGAPAGEAPDDEPRRYRSTPSWPPPPRRRSLWVSGLVLLVMAVMVALLITNGHVLGKSDHVTAGSAQQRPVLKTDPGSVPSDWIAYHHPTAGYSISYPPSWHLREEGLLVTIDDPSTGIELRLDAKTPPGQDPLKTWQQLEASFSSQHRGDYKRLQLNPASYLGHVGSLWEFTFLDGDVAMHAVDLGFLTKKYGFALYFQSTADRWQGALSTFYAFLSSFTSPK